MHELAKADLIAFEEGIAAEFNAGRIPYPVHLESGNEDALVEVFKDVRPDDWVFGSWRLHLKALLKGVSRETLRAAILRGESMALRFDRERVYGSAIVGGTLPLALGVALGIQMRGGAERVWCFMGDMTFRTGIAHECMTYAANFALPVRWIVEDNGLSVCTDTRAAWGLGRERGPDGPTQPHNRGQVSVYQYASKYPHAGAGVRVQF